MSAGEGLGGSGYYAISLQQSCRCTSLHYNGSGEIIRSTVTYLAPILVEIESMEPSGTSMIDSDLSLW